MVRALDLQVGFAHANTATMLPPMLQVTNSLLCVDCVWALRDLAGSKQHQQLAPLAATLYYHAAFASAATVAGRSAAAASGAAAPAAAAEVGSCGSNGDAPTAAGASTGKRRSSTAGISGATPAATAGGNGEVAGGDVDSEDELLQLPRKRSRVMGPAGQLLMFLQTDPERWVSAGWTKWPVQACHGTTVHSIVLTSDGSVASP